MQKDKVVEHIVEWLRNYAQESKIKGFVLGISGGIDSALVSTLCAKTGLEVLCISMPIHQKESEIRLVKTHINWLKKKNSGIQYQIVDLTETFDKMTASFPELKKGEDQHLALANTQARLRMATLYYFASLKQFLVAGTGNKIEDFGIGFYTKYGDGGVDLNPIADLYKSEVYELAAYLNIDESLLNAKPTDGLWGDNRTDEDQIGATYPELEWAMRQVEKGKTERDFHGRELTVFKNYQHRHHINRHKWQPIPVCKIPGNLKK